jgi:GNAT superfamily N-acetyltransferase
MLMARLSAGQSGNGAVVEGWRRVGEVWWRAFGVVRVSLYLLLLLLNVPLRTKKASRGHLIRYPFFVECYTSFASLTIMLLILPVETNLSLQSISTKYFSLWDPTINYKNDTLLYQVISTGCPEANYTECWRPHGLYILPSCQRRGLGALAVRWGMDRAATEGVPIVSIIIKSSFLRVSLYEKLGFRGVIK